MGIEPHQHWHNVEMFGNQGAAGVLTSFCDGLQRNAGQLADGDLFLLTVVWLRLHRRQRAPALGGQCHRRRDRLSGWALSTSPPSFAWSQLTLRVR